MVLNVRSIANAYQKLELGNNDATPVSTNGNVGYFNYVSIISRAKIISQIVAFIWYNVAEDDEKDEETESSLEDAINNGVEDKKAAEKAAKWFLEFGSNPNDNANLTLLMKAKPENNDEYGNFLKKVFPNWQNWNEEQKQFYKFPIFEPLDLQKKLFSIELDVNVFDGYFTDPDRYSENAIKVVIAFPPRPKLSPLTVTKDQLKQWIDNNETGSADFLPPSPYIPTCCS